MFPAANQVLVVRIVGSKTVGRTGESRFVFEVFDDKARTHISKHFAHCAPITGCQLHRQRGFRVRMNDNVDYPEMLEVLEEVPLPKARTNDKTLNGLELNHTTTWYSS